MVAHSPELKDMALVFEVAKLGAIGLPVAVIAASELTSMLDPALGAIINSLGVTGVLVWHFWYHTTKSYPELQRKAADQVAAAQDKSVLIVEKLRDAFEKETREQREYYGGQIRELQALVLQLGQAMRTAVHDVKDTANAAILKTTAVEARRTRGEEDTK
jgi:hypothetical protein